MTSGTRLRRGRAGLTVRLLTALGLVLLTAAATAGVVAAAIGPPLFHEHMVRAGLADDDAAVRHAEVAFRSASAVALLVAMAAAGVAALVVSLILARRIGRSLAAVGEAAARVGGGQYDARVPAPGLGAEFDDLAASFNHMAARLDAGERLRARLLADVAHEVRTPVATMNGYLEAVEDGVHPLDPATITLLRDQAARLTHLAEDLAAVTRAETGDLRMDLVPTPPGHLVDAAVQAGLERAAAQGVHLHGDAPDHLPDVAVDALRMGQVLDNLVANAVRHTPAGGQVTVRAEASDRTVLLSVHDTGEGIAAEHLPHLFERFYRSDTARDRVRGGSGIGLAIARALTEAHGGTISAASPGRGMGSTFTVSLPGC